MKKYLVVVLLIVLGVGGVFGFQSQQKKPEAVKKQKVVMLLDWTPNTNHTGLYVAKEKGYYDAENLDVQLIQPGEGDATQIVASGKVDFAISSQESVTLARAQNIPIVSIATILQHNTSAFASLKDQNITSMKDFENKRYGGWGSPIEKAVIESAMTDAGADYSKMKFITLGATDFLHAIGRDCDIQWIFYGWEGIEAKQQGKALNVIYLKDLNPVLDYYTPIIVTNENHISSQNELVKKFMQATAKGYTYAADHPDESAAILIKHVPEINKNLVKESQKWLSPQYTADAQKWGVQKPEVWKGYADWLLKHKQLEKQLDSQKAFTNEFL